MASSTRLAGVPHLQDHLTPSGGDGHERATSRLRQHCRQAPCPKPSSDLTAGEGDADPLAPHAKKPTHGGNESFKCWFLRQGRLASTAPKCHLRRPCADATHTN